MNLIKLQHTLPKVFAERDMAISDVWHKDLEFKKECIYLIEAASGTGKSSLCNYIYGYRTDYQGSICFDSENIKSLSIADWAKIRKTTISMLFQDLKLFPELSAIENVLLKNNLTGYKMRKEIEIFFDRLGIADKINSEVGKLSFGQQQRVALIRALCQPYDFIFLDEPVSHLDEENSTLMSELLMEEVSRQGAGVIITSIGKSIRLDYDKILKL